MFGGGAPAGSMDLFSATTQDSRLFHRAFHVLPVTLEQLYIGAEIEVRIIQRLKCKECKGKLLNDGSEASNPHQAAGGGGFGGFGFGGGGGAFGQPAPQAFAFGGQPGQFAFGGAAPAFGGFGAPAEVVAPAEVGGCWKRCVKCNATGNCRKGPDADFDIKASCFLIASGQQGVGVPNLLSLGSPAGLGGGVSFASPEVPNALCETCDGVGFIVLDDKKCRLCDGKGTVPVEVLTSVNVQPGMRPFDIIAMGDVIEEEPRTCGPYAFGFGGGFGFGAAPPVEAGECPHSFVLKLIPHPVAMRLHDDLVVWKRVTLLEALTSPFVEVPHPSGKVFKVRLPGGKPVTEGTSLVIEGGGMPVFAPHNTIFTSAAATACIEDDVAKYPSSYKLFSILQNMPGAGFSFGASVPAFAGGEKAKDEPIPKIGKLHVFFEIEYPSAIVSAPSDVAQLASILSAAGPTSAPLASSSSADDDDVDMDDDDADDHHAHVSAGAGVEPSAAHGAHGKYLSGTKPESELVASAKAAVKGKAAGGTTPGELLLKPSASVPLEVMESWPTVAMDAERRSDGKDKNSLRAAMSVKCTDYRQLQVNRAKAASAPVAAEGVAFGKGFGGFAMPAFQ